MRVESVEAIPASYPEPNDFHALRHLCLVKLTADDGQVGWGESITQFPEASFCGEGDRRGHGARLDPSAVVLVNAGPGETGLPVVSGDRGPESGFYLRRTQQATVDLGRAAPPPGRRRVGAEVGLGGVATDVLEVEIELT